MERNFGLLGSSKVKRLEQDETARHVFLERLLLQALIQIDTQNREFSFPDPQVFLSVLTNYNVHYMLK